MDKVPILTDYAVINDELLRRCVYIAPPVSAEAAAEPVTSALGFKKQTQKQKAVEVLPPPQEITKFTFSFCNLHEIKNLATFQWVTTLCLDNNHITEISGISHMKELRWLDLSFNKLTKISGLDTLTKLTDLTLYGNQISKLEGMDTLIDLECLSIGKNALKQLEDILYLRRFKKLRMLTLAGNPLDKDPEHKSFALAHIPSLKYLDYKLVESGEKIAAREAHEDLLLELDERDRQAAAAEAERIRLAGEEAELDAANVAGLGSLLQSMFDDDAEYYRVRHFEPLYEEQINLFREQMTAMIGELKHAVLTQLGKKRECATEYEVAVGMAKDEADSKSKALLKAFEKKKKATWKLVNELQKRLESAEDGGDDNVENELDGTLNRMRDDVNELQNALLDIENMLMEQIEGVNLEYVKDSETMSGQTRELVQGAFLKLQDIENVFFEKQWEKAFARFEQAQQNDQIVNEYEDVARQMLADKDLFTTAFQTSHDNHISKINVKEEVFQKRERAQLESLAKGVSEREYKRNRARVQEIWSYCDAIVQEIDALQNQLLPDESG